MNGLASYCTECGEPRNINYRCFECGTDGLCFNCKAPDRHDCRAASFGEASEDRDTDRIDWLEENPEAIQRIADELLESDVTVREAIDTLMDEFHNENEY